MGRVVCLLALVLMMLGCKSKERIIERETVRTDSLFKVVTDTVTVSVRVAEMPYTLPAVQLERTTDDTLSVLQDSLYKSVAMVSGGKLYHALYTLPDAVVRVPVQSTDTTKVRTEREYKTVTADIIESGNDVNDEDGKFSDIQIIVTCLVSCIICFVFGYCIKGILS